MMDGDLLGCLALPLVAIVSAGLTGLIRRYAITEQLMDVPNARSSHTVPTPRGGGGGIVIAFLAAVACLPFLIEMPAQYVFGLVGAGAFVASIGFIDDHRHVAARWRLFVHFLAAGWGLYWLGGVPPIDIGGSLVDLGWWGHGIAVMFLVWLLNLYNFMDGIDGIAAIEALTACLTGALITWLTGSHALAVLVAILWFSVAGFLYWNFPPARIFMGDVGSGFLGMILGLLSLAATTANPRLFWSWLILLGVFIVDATLTLLRRVWRGEAFYEAHRSHAYQHAARRCGTHKTVTMCVALINLVWLSPFAVSVALGWIGGPQAMAIAYAPLVVLALLFGAGARERQKVAQNPR